MNISTQVSIFTIASLLTSTLWATPYDGIYTARELDILEQIAGQYERKLRGMFLSDMLVPEFITIQLSIQEIETGKITLLKRNSSTNEFQAFVGYPTDTGYRFVNTFNQIQYAFFSDENIQIVSEEIYIEFDDFGNGFYSYTLVLKGETFFTGVTIPKDGKVELVSTEPITKLGPVIYPHREP